MSAVATDGPFDPHEWDSEEEKSDEVGDEEGTAVLCAEAWESEEVAEPDGVSCHGQHKTDA